jgi:hypothetical protein
MQGKKAVTREYRYCYRKASKKGKRNYDDEVIASLRLIGTFFGGTYGKILASFMRQQMKYIQQWTAFQLTEGSGNACKDKPCGHRPVSKNRPSRVQAYGEKPHQTPYVTKKPHPDTHFLFR